MAVMFTALILISESPCSMVSSGSIILISSATAITPTLATPQ